MQLAVRLLQPKSSRIFNRPGQDLPNGASRDNSRHETVGVFDVQITNEAEMFPGAKAAAILLDGERANGKEFVIVTELCAFCAA